MSVTKLHQQKKAKNYTVLAIVFAFMVVFFLVTVIRLQQGIEASGAVLNGG